jgi:hypothetical protein
MQMPSQCKCHETERLQIGGGCDAMTNASASHPLRWVIALIVRIGAASDALRALRIL